MLRSLRIENFRCFRTFELQQLGRLNLLVGTNNSGKTSILEAVQLLTSSSNLESFWEVIIGRGEYVVNDERNISRELDVRHLFYGREIDLGSKFSILGDNHGNREGVSVSIGYAEWTPKQIKQFRRLRKRDFESPQQIALIIEWSGQENERIDLPLSSVNGLHFDYVQRVYRDSNHIRKDSIDLEKRTQFITSSSLEREND
jgi:AAA15 family ATPase/GTPase